MTLIDTVSYTTHYCSIPKRTNGLGLTPRQNIKSGIEIDTISTMTQIVDAGVQPTLLEPELKGGSLNGVD